MGEGVSSENTQMFVASSDIDLDPLALPLIEPQAVDFAKTRATNVMNQCVTCSRFDENKNLVM